jgi:alpha-galactosidase
VVATVSVTLSPLVTTTSITISNALGATAAGAGLAITSSGGTITVTATGGSSATRYVSDLTWTSMTNGWGPVEKDMSNGEQAAGDGHTISIRGVTYAKGLGAHAVSNVQYSLTAAGACTAFLSDVGVDDETGGAGSVVFQVWADGTKLFDSGLMTGTMAAKSVNVAVTGKSLLTLMVNDGGDGITSDHADWANARLTCQ